ncbi:MAG TPA: SCO family protein, partial [Pseudoxanthomonas sp.]|nr:SCO family protein [Pseudoxanthomonas sp.]
EAFAKSIGFVFMKVPGKNFEENPQDYAMDHSSGIAVLDPQGRVAGLIRPPFAPKAIADDLAALTEATVR